MKVGIIRSDRHYIEKWQVQPNKHNEGFAEILRKEEEKIQSSEKQEKK